MPDFKTVLHLIAVLPGQDWMALTLFFVGWVAYARWSKHFSAAQRSLLAVTNDVRRRWMWQSTRREMRVLDGAVVQALNTSPSFFASTTILIIGGLLAVLVTGDKASELMRELPFAARTSALVFDMKVLLLLGIFVYAFFRFTWSMRQYTFGALMLASVPEAAEFRAMPQDVAERRREAFAEHGGRVVALAASTFNDGLRAYYMAFAALGWFFSPFAMIAGTAGVLWILYQREFHSEVLGVLRSATRLGALSDGTELPWHPLPSQRGEAAEGVRSPGEPI